MVPLMYVCICSVGMVQVLGCGAYPSPCWSVLCRQGSNVALIYIISCKVHNILQFLLQLMSWDEAALPVLYFYLEVLAIPVRQHTQTYSTGCHIQHFPQLCTSGRTIGEATTLAKYAFNHNTWHGRRYSKVPPDTDYIASQLPDFITNHHVTSQAYDSTHTYIQQLP